MLCTNTFQGICNLYLYCPIICLSIWIFFKLGGGIGLVRFSWICLNSELKDVEENIPSELIYAWMSFLIDMSLFFKLSHPLH